MASSSTNPKAKRPGWPLVAGGAVVALFAIYLLLTSGWFIRWAVFPRVATALSSDIQAEAISVGLLSGVDVRKFALTPKGQAPLVTFDDLRVRFRLISLFTGAPEITEVSLENPRITITQPKGKPGNLDTLLAGLKPGAPSKPSKSTPHVTIRNVKISGAAFRLSTGEASASAKGDVTEITGLNLNLDQLGNNLDSKLDLALVGQSQKASGDLAAAQLKGSVAFALDSDLLPNRARGSFGLETSKATGAFAPAVGLSAQIGVDAGAGEVKAVTLKFTRRGADLGAVTINGRFNLAQREVRLNYDISGVGRDVVSLAGGLLGMDLGNTTVAARGGFDVTEYGNLLSLRGALTVGQFSLGRTNGVTAPLDSTLNFKISAHLREESATLDDFTFSVRKGADEIIAGKPDRPVNISWGLQQQGFREASYDVAIKSLKLSDWQPFLGDLTPQGAVSSKIRIFSQRDGHFLRLTVSNSFSGVEWKGGGPHLTNLSGQLDLDGTVEEFNDLRLNSLSGALARNAQQILTWQGSCQWDHRRNDGGAQLSFIAGLPEILAINPVSGVSLSRGSANASLELSHRGGSLQAAGTVSLEGLTGVAGGATLSNYLARVEISAKKVEDSVTISKAQLNLQNGFEDGGGLDLNGHFDLKNRQGEFEFHIANLSRAGLSPWVKGELGGHPWVSGRFKGSGRGAIDTAGTTQAKAAFDVSEFVLLSSPGASPPRPVGFGFSVDASQTGRRYVIQSAELNLGRTALATNRLVLSGSIDLSPTNANPAQLALTSDGLDLTEWYRWSKQVSAPSTTAPARPSTADPVPGEPAPISLPIQKAEASIDIKRFYLNGLVITNWLVKSTLDHGVVVVDPFRLSLSPGALDAKFNVDLRKQGYVYQIAANLNSIGIPGVLSVAATNLLGQMEGVAAGKLSIQGAGITPASLARNLSGQFQFAGSNLNFKLTALQSGFLKSLANLILGLPELVKNPAGTIGNLLGQGSSGDKKQAGWVDELQGSPIQEVGLTGDIKSGTVQIKQAMARSAALRVNAPGKIELLPIITNSPILFSVDVGVKPSLGSRIGLAGGSDPYSSMPKDFLTVAGTLGNPKAKPDYGKLLRLAGKGALGIGGDTLGSLTGTVGGAGSPLNGLFKGIGNLINGTNAPAGTNTTGSPLDPLKLFKQ